MERFVCSIMTNKIQLIAILTLTSILITGGFCLTQLAYSTGSNSGNSNSNNYGNSNGYHHDDDDEDDDDDGKVKICHIPQGNPGNAHTIRISQSALQTHLNHGDTKGVCPQDEDDDDDEDDDEQGEDPATITIINNVASDTQPFDITVLPNVSEEIIDSTTTKYTVDSHTTVKILGDPDRPILITGDGNCPENNGGFVNIEKGQNITCIYDDRPVGQAGPSPTVTLKVKVIDVELGVTEDVPPSFQVDGNDVSLNELITLITDKATEITQTNNNVLNNSEENNEVLPSKITGDGHCPEVLAGTITLSSGQDIECVFEYGAEIEPGVIFHYDTQMVGREETPVPNAGPPCGMVVPFMIGGIDQGSTRYENTATQGPCIAINGPDIWVVPDPTVTLTDTTIVLFTVIITGSDVETQIEPLATTCVFNGLAPTLDETDGDETIVEPTPLAFRLYCVDLPDEGNWNVNYALIEADPLA